MLKQSSSTVLTLCRLFRRKCLVELSLPVQNELDFIEETAGGNPKNYQMWFHRRELCSKNPQLALGEIAYSSRVLNHDAKNYHAWSHRQWAIIVAGNFDEDLGFTHALLDKDGRNNSAWNHKWFLVTQGSSLQLSKEALLEQLSELGPFLSAAPSNEAAWNYFKGLLQQKAAIDEQVQGAAEAVHSAAQLSQASLGDKSNAAQPLAAKLHLLQLRKKASGESLAAEFRQACSELIAVDPIRARYWARRQVDFAQAC